jgi:hypothetical protein
VFASISAGFDAFTSVIGLVDWFEVRSVSAAFDAEAAGYDRDSAEFASNLAGIAAILVEIDAIGVVSGVLRRSGLRAVSQRGAWRFSFLPMKKPRRWARFFSSFPRIDLLSRRINLLTT